MKVPEVISMRNTCHGSGAKGMAFYTYEDTYGLGVVHQARRESSRHAFIDTWRFKWLPDREFPSFAALRDALEHVTDEQVAAEKAKWPADLQVRELSDPETTNGCWRHRDRKAAIQASVATCWIAGEAVIVSLCAECAVGVSADDVIEVVEERRASVAARKAGAA